MRRARNRQLSLLAHARATRKDGVVVLLPYTWHPARIASAGCEKDAADFFERVRRSGAHVLHSDSFTPPADSCLFVIDPQNDFVAPTGSLRVEGGEVDERLEVLNRARDRDAFLQPQRFQKRQRSEAQ